MMLFYGLMGISMVFGLIGGVVSKRLQSKFTQYSQIPTSSGLLTDHYNPKSKIINLSPEVYGGRSVSAAAVAAHEVGHAVQHAESYAMLQFRSAIVPVIQFSSNIQKYLFTMGFMVIGFLGNANFLMIAIALFGLTALFSVITLPVEFDASKRALAWLDASNITRGTEYDGAKDALKWAAMTYVVGAAAAVAQVLYLVVMFYTRSKIATVRKRNPSKKSLQHLAKD